MAFAGDPPDKAIAQARAIQEALTTYIEDNAPN